MVAKSESQNCAARVKLKYALNNNLYGFSDWRWDMGM